MWILFHVLEELLVLPLYGSIHTSGQLWGLAGKDVRNQEVVSLHRKLAAGCYAEAIATTVHPWTERLMDLYLAVAKSATIAFVQ